MFLEIWLVWDSYISNNVSEALQHFQTKKLHNYRYEDMQWTVLLISTNVEIGWFDWKIDLFNGLINQIPTKYIDLNG